MNSQCNKTRIDSNGVSVINDDVKLVDNVSFSVDEGEILAIIGPNGAGKSTLLKAIAGDIPFHGALTIHDLDRQAKKRARQLAVLPQFSLLNFPYLVSEVVGLGRTPHQSGWQKDNDIIAQALELLDITYLSERKYTLLSGGEKQRVQLARVMCQIWRAQDAENGTRVLLLDEPTAALDLGHQKQLVHALKEFSQQGVTIVTVMHDINLATSFADKILAMAGGQLVEFGRPQQVVTVDTMRQLFNTQVSIATHPEHQTPIILGY